MVELLVEHEQSRFEIDPGGHGFSLGAGDIGPRLGNMSEVSATRTQRNRDSPDQDEFVGGLDAA